MLAHFPFRQYLVLFASNSFRQKLRTDENEKKKNSISRGGTMRKNGNMSNHFF